MSKTTRQAERVTGHQPGMLQDDSRELTAWLADKPDAMRHAREAVVRIKAGRVSAADELNSPEIPDGCRGCHTCAPTAAEHQCCGALASGPHKMGCDYKMHEAAAPAKDEYWCELCGDSLTTLRHDAAIGWYRNCDHCGSEYQGKEERSMNKKPCRCGPDGCADSAACLMGEG